MVGATIRVAFWLGCSLLAQGAPQARCADEVGSTRFAGKPVVWEGMVTDKDACVATCESKPLCDKWTWCSSCQNWQNSWIGQNCWTWPASTQTTSVSSPGAAWTSGTCAQQAEDALPLPPLWEKRRDLFDTYNADMAPPNMKLNAPLQVLIGLSIKKMVYSITTGDLELDIWFRLKWLDERLAYAGSDFFGNAYTSASYMPVDIFDGPQEFLWTPDIHNLNATDFFANMNPNQAMVYPYPRPASVAGEPAPEWNVYWVQSGRIGVYCRPDVKDFPFDHQACKLRFQSWASPSFFLQLVKAPDLWQELVELPSSEQYEFEEFTFPEETTGQEYGALKGASWSSFDVELHVRRYPMYYWVNAIIPMLMMVFLSFLSFWIPIKPDHSGSGERLGYCITSLLTIVAVSLFTADKRPMLNESTWLDRFQAHCIFFTFVPIVETAVVFWIENVFLLVKNEKLLEEKDVRRTFLESTAGIPCVHRTNDEVELDHIVRKVDDNMVQSAKNTLKSMSVMEQCGLIFPHIIDRYFRHFYPIVATAFILRLFIEIDYNFITLVKDTYSVGILQFPLFFMITLVLILGIVEVAFDTRLCLRRLGGGGRVCDGQACGGDSGDESEDCTQHDHGPPRSPSAVPLRSQQGAGYYDRYLGAGGASPPPPAYPPPGAVGRY